VVDDPRERADRRAAWFALVAAALMIAQQVGSKATRDALFLSSFDVEDLPQMVIAGAAASLVGVFLASRAFSRFGPARVVPVAFVGSGALYFAEWALADDFTRPVAVVLFIHVAVFGALVISGFWSVVNERFDPHTAKQMIGRIGTGATFGGVAGGLLAERVGSMLTADAMLFALGILNVCAAAGVVSIGRPDEATPHPTASSANAFGVLRRAPYLQQLAGLVLLTAVSAALLDYAFKAEAAEHYESGQHLLQFFALFHVVSAVLSLVLQMAVAKPALEKLGVAGAAATLPAVVLITAAVATGLTKLATLVVARGAEQVVANSVFRSGYELLYTPVQPDQKRPTKTLIDVAGNRVGDALGSAVVLGVLAVVPAAMSSRAVLVLAVVGAVVSLWIARRLHRGYVSQLEARLETDSPIGAAELQQATLQTLSTLGLDREALFEQIAAHESYGDRFSSVSIDGPDPSIPPPREPDGIDAPDDDPIHDSADTLRHGTAEEICALLDEPIDERLVPFVIALLARRDVYHAAVKALRPFADAAVEPMVAALTDPDQPFAIRRRLPRVLQACDSDEGARGLERGLDDEYFEVRYRCGIALARIAQRLPERAPTRERVLERVAFELSKSRSIWDKRRLLDDDDDDGTPLLQQKAERDRVHRSVEHVFTLLSLSYEKQPLRLALFALSGDDRALRGTALEYLENILPDSVRDALFPMLDARVEIRRKRTEREIVQELVRSVQAMDAEALRDAIEKNRSSPPSSGPSDPSAPSDPSDPEG